MTDKPNLAKPLIFNLFYVACIFIFSACATNRHSEKIVTIKKWIHWQIEVKQGTSNEERDKAILELDRYILMDISKQGLASKIVTIKFSHIIIENKDIIEIWVDVGGPVSLPAVAVRVPPKPVPNLEFFNLFGDIKDMGR